MKRVSLLFSVLFACSLAACGGGSSGGITPSPVPTLKPQTYVSVSEQQGSVASVARHPDAASCSATPAPLVVQATGNYSPPQYSSWGVSWQSVTATEYSATCQAMNSHATYASQNAQVATLALPSAAPQPQPTPAAGSVFISGGTPGGTTVVASFPDGTSANIAVSAYDELELSCDRNVNAYLGQQFGATQYSGDVWNDSVGDVQESCYGRTVNPAPTPDAQDQGFQVSFPYGYAIAKTNAQTADFSSLLSCGTVSTGNTALTANNVPSAPFILLFNTHDGKCVKAYAIQQSPPNISPILIKAYYAVSNATGKFAY